jgi:hypothetical protein
VIREDYLIRMIRQFGAFLAKLAGLRANGELELALARTEEGYELLGVPRGLVDEMDSPSLGELLADPDKMRMAARLFWEEARLIEAKGDPLTAFERYRRAIEMFLEARARDPQEDDDHAILELSRKVPAQHLDPHYRDDAHAFGAS